MTERIASCSYFEQAGPANTRRTLELAFERAHELGIEHIILPSTSGATGLEALKRRQGEHLVVVSHSAGFSKPNSQSLPAEVRKQLEESGVTVVTCQHALGGVGRAIRRKLGTYQVDEIIAFAWRTMCQGFKVACEIAMMAADCGAIPVGEEIVALGGTGRGVDTAVVLKAANAQDLFDLRVLEVICKPRAWE